MFYCDDESFLLWFKPFSKADLLDFYYAGVIVGLAMNNFSIINLHFPLAFYKKLVDMPVTFDDFAELKPSIASNLSKMMAYTGEDFEQVFFQSFSVFVDDVEHEIIPHGKDISVTQENKEEFKRLYVEFHLSACISAQFLNFKKGFKDVCSGKSLSLFVPEELRIVIQGADTIDLDLLKEISSYQGFSSSDPIIL